MPNTKIVSGIPIEWCDYSDSQLVTMYSYLINNLQSLAENLDQSRPDVSMVIDSIIDHPNQIVEIDIKDCHESGMLGNTIIMIDRKNHKFNFIDAVDGAIIGEANALTIEQLNNKLIKKEL